MACTILVERTPFVDAPFFWSQHYDSAINNVGHSEPWETIEIEGSYSEPAVTAVLRDVPIRRTVQSGPEEYDVAMASHDAVENWRP